MTKVTTTIFLIFSLGLIFNFYVSAKDHSLQFKSIEFPFDISFHTEKIKNDQFYLVTTLEVDSGSYFISPFSSDDILMHFSINLDSNQFINPDDQLLEIPSPREEYDSVLEQKVKYVREKTTYKRKITLTSKDDFKASGLVEFLVEPRCVPYHVAFEIIHQSGQLKIAKTKTTIPSFYKGPYKQ